MIEERINVKGTVGLDTTKIYPVTQEKSVIPTTKIQEIISDENYDALSKVTVEPIPNEYKISTFTGSYDRDGLKQIGWTEEEIDYYNQYGVQWNVSENNYYKLTESELIGNDNQDTRYLPKISEKKYFNFHYYYHLIAMPLLDISIRTDLNLMFGECYSLTTIPQLDTSNATDMSYMFGNCHSLTTIPKLDTSNVTNISGMFKGCTSLTTVPQLDTSNATDMSYMFQTCNSLTTIPQLDTSNVTNTRDTLYYLTSLENFGGLLNLGQAYSTSLSANYYTYGLKLSNSTKLTHESLMNIINGLYDIKTKGCKSQQLVFGATNLAKLTSEEIAIATNKGWSVS